MTRIAQFKDSFYVTSLAFSANGDNIATNFAQERTIHVWEWKGRARVIKTLEKPPYTGSVNLWDRLRYSRDGRFLAIAYRWSAASSGDTYVRVWDTTTWAIAHEFAWRAGAEASGLGFTSDGKYFAIAGIRAAERKGEPASESLVLYDTHSWQPSWELNVAPLNITELALSADGRFAALGGTRIGPDRGVNPELQLVDLARHAVSRTIKGFPAGSDFECIAWSADGSRVAAGIMPRLDESPLKVSTVKVFSAETGQQISADNSSDVTHIRGLQYTADGSYLVEASLSDSVKLWTADQRNLLQTIPIDPSATAVSGDGRYMAIAAENTVSVWQLN